LFKLALKLYSFTGNKSPFLPIAIAPNEEKAAVSPLVVLFAVVANAGAQLVAL
jgi:hypothetical protein